MRLTFQDGSEWDISADIEFAGLSEKTSASLMTRS